MSDIKQLSTEELVEQIFKQLSGDHCSSPPIEWGLDPRFYGHLIKTNNEYSPAFWHQFRQALLLILRHPSKDPRLDREARNNLFALLRDERYRFVEPIELYELANNRIKSSTGGDDWVDFQAGILQCLEHFKYRASKEFWRRHLELLGSDYGALIFSGLLLHGLDPGMRCLPKIQGNEVAVYWVKCLLPDVSERFGKTQTQRAYSKSCRAITGLAKKEWENELELGGVEYRPFTVRVLFESLHLTLPEAAIVTVILAAIAAIAIPNLLRSRMQSNEASAIGNLRTIVGAEVAYHAANYEYTTDFADLTGATPSFLDGNWDGTKSGYNYLLGGDSNNFTANANAEVYGATGSKGFFTDSSGIIRYADGADADASSDLLGE